MFLSINKFFVQYGLNNLKIFIKLKLYLFDFFSAKIKKAKIKRRLPQAAFIFASHATERHI